MSAHPRRPIADLVREVRSGSLGKDEALLSMDPRLVARGAFTLTAEAERDALRGVPAGHGVASGHAVFKGVDGIELARCDVPFVLVAYETFPDDIEAMKLASGVITVSGGITGHAGVVSRGLGKPCIGSGSSLDLHGERLETQAPHHLVWSYGDRLSFDGKTGMIGDGPLDLSLVDGALEEPLAWADSVSGAKLVAAVSSEVDARNAKRFGASSIAIDASDALFLGRARRELTTRARAGDANAIEALEASVEAELTSMGAAFGRPLDYVRKLRLDVHRDPHLENGLTTVCERLDIPFEPEAPRRATAVDMLPEARLSAALAVIGARER